MKMPKKIATLLTVTLIAGSVPLNIVNADTKAIDDKLIGSGRWETAIEVSKKGWTSATNVVIVNENSIPDALAATPFADAKNAPILLTGKDKLDDRTKKELKRLGAKTVYLIGGEAVLSENIEKELKEENITVDRIDGINRETTAIEVAKRLDKIQDVSEIAVVNGTNGLADAVSIAAVAAKKDMPIILSNDKDGTKDSDEFIKSEDIKATYVIGGESVIANSIKDKLPNANRIAGIDRNETNAKVIEKFYTEKELNNAYVAKDGMQKQELLIDALAVGPLAAKNDSPVIIVGQKLNQAQKDITNTKSFATITQVGGNGNEASYNELKSMQGVTTYNVKTVEELNVAIAKANANDIINMDNKVQKSTSDSIIIKTDKVITVNLHGNYKNSVTISAPNTTIINHGTIETLVVDNSNGGEIKNIEGSTISNIEVKDTAANITVENKGTVGTITNNANGTEINNEGTIEKPIEGNVDPTINGNDPVEVYEVKTTEELRKALETSKNGDTINIAAGNYEIGTITINKSINLVGKDKKNTVIKGKIVASSDDISNLSVSNLTIEANSRHIALTENTKVKNIKVDNVIFNHTESANQATMYFWGTQEQGGYDLISITNSTFNYPNAQEKDMAFVGQTWDAKKVVFSNNTINENGNGTIRKGFELSGVVKEFTAQGNKFDKTEYALFAWLTDVSTDAVFNINNNTISNTSTAAITIDEWTGKVLGTLNASGNIFNNCAKELLVENGITVNNGNMAGSYPNK